MRVRCFSEFFFVVLFPVSVWHDTLYQFKTDLVIGVRNQKRSRAMKLSPELDA